MCGGLKGSPYRSLACPSVSQVGDFVSLSRFDPQHADETKHAHAAQLLHTAESQMVAPVFLVSLFVLNKCHFLQGSTVFQITSQKCSKVLLLKIINWRVGQKILLWQIAFIIL